MAQKLSRRDGLKLLAAAAGGAAAMVVTDEESTEGLLPTGGGGSTPAPASPGEYQTYHADTFGDVAEADGPALVVVSGESDYGLVEVR